MRHDGSGGHRKACGERLAPTLREEGDDWGYSHGQTHGKYGPSLDGYNKVRKYEKSRQVQKNYQLLNRTQISFYDCTALLSGPKQE